VTSLSGVLWGPNVVAGVTPAWRPGFWHPTPSPNIRGGPVLRRLSVLLPSPIFIFHRAALDGVLLFGAAGVLHPRWARCYGSSTLLWLCRICLSLAKQRAVVAALGWHLCSLALFRYNLAHPSTTIDQLPTGSYWGPAPLRWATNCAVFSEYRLPLVPAIGSQADNGRDIERQSQKGSASCAAKCRCAVGLVQRCVTCVSSSRFLLSLLGRQWVPAVPRMPRDLWNHPPLVPERHGLSLVLNAGRPSLPATALALGLSRAAGFNVYMLSTRSFNGGVCRKTIPWRCSIWRRQIFARHTRRIWRSTPTPGDCVVYLGQCTDAFVPLFEPAELITCSCKAWILLDAKTGLPPT